MVNVRKIFPRNNNRQNVGSATAFIENCCLTPSSISTLDIRAGNEPSRRFHNQGDLPGALFAIVELTTSRRLVCSSNQHMCLVIYKLIDMFWCKHSLGTLQLLRHWGSIRDDQWSRFSAVKLPSHFLPLPHLHCTHWNIIKLLNVISRAVLYVNRLQLYLS